MQTSISQRPLTAKKRQLQAAQGQVNRLHQGNGLVPDSTAQQQLSGSFVHLNNLNSAGVTYNSRGNMATSSIPAFRTAGKSSQLMQRSSQDRNHPAGSDSAGQTVHLHQEGLLSAQPQPQQRRRTIPEQANLAGAQWGTDTVTSPRNDAQPSRSSAWEGSSYEREASGAAAGALHSAQQQAHDPHQSDCSSVPLWGGGLAQPRLPQQQRAGAEEMDGSRRTAARETAMMGQAAPVAAAGAAKPLMYVKPPWAIDDPYQVASHKLQVDV